VNLNTFAIPAWWTTVATDLVLPSVISSNMPQLDNVSRWGDGVGQNALALRRIGRDDVIARRDQVVGQRAIPQRLEDQGRAARHRDHEAATRTDIGIELLEARLAAVGLGIGRARRIEVPGFEREKTRERSTASGKPSRQRVSVNGLPIVLRILPY
jgi:hypothetical protein